MAGGTGKQGPVHSHSPSCLTHAQTEGIRLAPTAAPPAPACDGGALLHASGRQRGSEAGCAATSHHARHAWQGLAQLAGGEGCRVSWAGLNMLSSRPGAMRLPERRGRSEVARPVSPETLPPPR